MAEAGVPDDSLKIKQPNHAPLVIASLQKLAAAHDPHVATTFKLVTSLSPL
jgi:hypothetical protein